MSNQVDLQVVSIDPGKKVNGSEVSAPVIAKKETETIEMNPVQYAKWLGCSKSKVHKEINRNNLQLLPCVVRIKRNGWWYVLDVETSKDRPPRNKYIHPSRLEKFGKEWADLYNSGKSISAIAKTYSRHHKSVKNQLIQQGIGGFRTKINHSTKEIGYNYFVIKNENGCWGWSGSIMNKGYGCFSVHYKSMLAHRVSYEIHKGECAGKFVCHTCDNPICTNPEHLFLGTQLENMTDCIEKGRHGRSKLKIKDVIEIKKMLQDGLRNQEIASKYGVVRKAISRIRSGSTWSHITI